MPSEAARPVVNLFHSRLILAVDWFRTAEGGELFKSTGGNGPPSCECQFIIYIMHLLSDCL